jgi:hypothetical protein
VYRNNKTAPNGFALRDDVVYILTTAVVVAKFGIVAGIPVLAVAVCVSHLYPLWRKRTQTRTAALVSLKRIEAQWPTDETQRRRDGELVAEAARMFKRDDIDVYTFQRDLADGVDVREQAKLVRAKLER